uniref:Uncharacterized protein n=1 Tax=viral metagenome TaxID=1070528 RepID=A0A6C0DIL4_9ZZZZ
MNDIKTLVVTSFFLAIGGGIIYFLKQNDGNEIDNGENTTIDEVNRSYKKKRANKSKINYDEKSYDNTDDTAYDDQYNDQYDNQYNDYDNEDNDKAKTRTIIQTKTKKNRGKQSVSKKRYY